MGMSGRKTKDEEDKSYMDVNTGDFDIDTGIKVFDRKQ